MERLNDFRIDHFLQKVQQALWVFKDKRLAVWGLAFKPETDDVRETPSVKVCRRLCDEGAYLQLYDPQAADNFRTSFSRRLERLSFRNSAEEAARNAHAILLMTEWPEFQDVNWKRLREIMAMPIVVDARNALELARLEKAGFEYYCLGRPSGSRQG